MVGNGSPPRERLRSLVSSLLTLGTDLEGEQAAERILRSASELVRGRYAVLRRATPPHGTIELYLHGLSRAEYAERTDRPDFARLVEQLTLSGRPVRTPTLLGVPLRPRDHHAGQLLVGDPEAGRFTQDDEDLLAAYGAAAAMVMYRADLHERGRRQQRWLHAVTELTDLLLGQVDREKALGTLTARLREVSGADYCALLLLDPADPETGTLHAVTGLSLEHQSGSRTPLRGLTARVVRTRRSVVSPDLDQVYGYGPPPEWRTALAELGLGMLLPLRTDGEVLGVLFAGWRKGSPVAHLAAREVELVEMFAHQAALALRQARAQTSRTEKSVVADRERIAEDLDTVVAHRLSRVAEDLGVAVERSRRPVVRERLAVAAREVDETIARIHGVSGDLRTPAGPGRGASRCWLRLQAELAGARDRFGVAPGLEVHGSLDGLSEATQCDLAARVRQALDRAAEYDSPSRVDLVLDVEEGRLRLIVAGARNHPPADPEASLGTSFATLAGEQVTEWAVRLG
ncbi:GAF domain-containing protein [Actinopolymorpha cephalotaxi]|uniref:GAF domain-containing protein n=1 Tax=Actinopolymorpha cephalotaxi TaxID=504797 RepID=A0A1I3AFG6_9ACTN|nr:GAF domain-containing protein [Actinopolymorpha cephalotaxi]NYH82107.1 GAF domain-containing protein [Actinopolymorpha cephalotaxi]SFH48700.1 GAF domain-containing protein [Actinopolymorpha cephalotaxi]